MERKFSVGDVVSYRHNQEEWLMRIDDFEFKRCKGDLLKHKYYHGIAARLETGNRHYQEGQTHVSTTTLYYSATTISNAPESRLSPLSPEQKKDLETMALMNFQPFDKYPQRHILSSLAA